MKKIECNKGQAVGVAGLIVFATMVIVGLNVYQTFDTTASGQISSTTSSAYLAYQNTSVNTFSSFNLVSVGPIIYGAVIILGIVGLLYMRRR